MEKELLLKEIGLTIKVKDNGEVISENKHLSFYLDKDGYPKCSVYINGKKKHIFIHRLVAMAFIPNPENKPTVNHINGIKTDNRLENLEWATHKEQRIHAIQHHLCDRNLQILHIANLKRSMPVIFNNVKYNSLREAKRQTGCDIDTIKKYGQVL